MREILSPKLIVLESVVSGAIVRLEDKLEYWGNGQDIYGATLWERPGALGEESLGELLNSVDLDTLAGRNEWAIVGVGWELIWGDAVPDKVIEKRDKVIERFEADQELTIIEELWMNLILVDTDMF